MRFNLRILWVALLLAWACGGGGQRDQDGGPDSSSGLDSALLDLKMEGSAEIPVDAHDAATEGNRDAPVDLLPFRCIEGWPSFTPVPKAAPAATDPKLLWSTSLPIAGSVAPLITAVAGGVAVAAGDTLFIIDRGGDVTASVSKPQVDFGTISAAAATADGTLVFADSTAIYRVDAAGEEIWRTPVGASQASGEFVSPGWSIMDPQGRVHIAALDGKLWTLASQDGRVISNVPIGLVDGLPRLVQVGVASVLFMNRPNTSATTGRSLGAFLPATGSWAGEITDGSGWLPENAMVGFQIGIVAYGYRSIVDETSETIVLDQCGALRWRVPGAYSRPLAITFDDDLVIRDSIPAGGGAYQHRVRRFSRDGALLAGPLSTDLLGPAVVGADDTLYLVTCSALQTSVEAFDSSLSRLWSLPLGATFGCGRGAVLDEQGKLFVLGYGTTLVAVQTTSPGPAKVSWGRNGGRDARSTWWLSEP